MREEQDYYERKSRYESFKIATFGIFASLVLFAVMCAEKVMALFQR